MTTPKGSNGKTIRENEELDQLNFLGITIVKYFIGFLIVGILSILILSISNFDKFLSVFSGCIMIGAGALTFGQLMGFLFAVPRTPKTNNDSEFVVNPQNPAPKRLPKYKTNTSLEEISDWLTKIIVGVGLTQLSEIGPSLQRLSDYLSKTIMLGETGSSYVWALLLFTSVLGFIFGYIITRMYFPYVLEMFEFIQDRVFNTFVKFKTEIKKEFENKVDKAVEFAFPTNSMFDALYEPKGYDKVIEIADGVKNKSAAPPDDVNFWIYLAAAYGQKYRNTQDTDTRAEIRQGALDAVKKALEINSSNAKPRLRYIWDVNSHPDDPLENDLSDFRNDPDFIKLLE